MRTVSDLDCALCRGSVICSRRERDTEGSLQNVYPKPNAALQVAFQAALPKFLLRCVESVHQKTIVVPDDFMMLDGPKADLLTC